MEEITKKKYEISFLLKSEESLADIFAVLERYGSEIEKKDNILKKIPLAYKVKKYSEAFFGFFIFSVAPADVLNISKELNLKSEILRFLIVLPFAKIENKERSEKAPEEKRIKPEISPEKEEKEPEIISEKVSSLSNEALEKKLEEILG
ncbi:MAG: 30S ribosomal protein S6 [Candidatus Paceibacterota bacterium]